MADITGGSLGKASLDLEANLAEFERNVKRGEKVADGMSDHLDALAAVANIAERELNRVKMSPSQQVESERVASRIEASTGRVGRAAMEASEHLGKVKLTAAQAAETDAAGDVIDRKLKDITGNANEARRAVESVSLASAATRNPGVGVGPFGSGFGRVGLLGTAIGAGTLLSPAAGPGVLGLLASLPVFASAGAGAVGVLALAFQGVGKAIEGDKKAYDALQPSQKQFVDTVRSLTGELHTLEETAAKATFPGFTSGLKSALSPGTLGAITGAVNEFGHAIGFAGEEWGRYFGSSEFQQIFGPLMASGAHEVEALSDSALHLADSVGLLGRAGIPLTEWITNTIDKGSRLADAWLHDKDASGELAGAMNEAHTSLLLVAHLIEALGGDVSALGQALYPVSKVAVKDLTDGLNYLQGVINRNQDEIRDFVNGGLSALVTTARIGAPIVGTLAHDAEAVAHAVGGWKTVFEIVIGGYLASKFVALATSIAGTATKIALIGVEAGTAEAELGTLRLALLGLGGPEVLAALAAAAAGVAGIEFLKNQAGHIVSQEGNTVTLDNGKTYGLGAGRVSGTYTGPGSGVDQSTIPTSANNGGGVPRFSGSLNSPSASGKMTSQQIYSLLIGAGFSPGDASNFVGIAQAESGYRYDALNNNPSTGDYSVGLFQENFYKSLGPARTARYAPQFGLSPSISPQAFVQWLQSHPEAQAKIALDLFQSSGYQPWMGDAFVKAHPELLGGTDHSVFGPDPAFTKNLGPKPPKPSPIPTLASHLANLATVNAGKASGLSNVGGTAKRYLQDELMDLEAEEKSLQSAYDKAHGKAKTQIGNALAAVEAKIPKVQKLIADAIVKTGAALLPEKLKETLTAQQVKFKADATLAQSLTGKAAQDFQTTLLSDLNGEQTTLASEVTSLTGMLASAHGKQKTAIKTELAKVRTQLQKVDQQVVENLQQTVSTLQGQVGTALGNVTSELDAEYEQATQKLLDAAAAKYFQNGAKTPLEQQLAAMQAADQATSLTDALTAAKKQLADDVKSSADAATRAADEKAIEQAQRSIDENDLAIRAAAERAKADADYAAETKRIQQDRSAQEAEMNRQLAKLGDALQNGSGSIDDLSSIAAAYGLQIDTTTIPDFDTLSSTVGELQSAFKDLADYIGKLTGVTPKIPTVSTGGGSAASSASMAAIYARAVALAGVTLPSNIHYPGIPQLDVGGHVLETGLAVVHRGEDWSGVGAHRRPGEGATINVYGAVGNHDEIAMAIGRAMQKLNKRGVRFEIV